MQWQQSRLAAVRRGFLLGLTLTLGLVVGSGPTVAQDEKTAPKSKSEASGTGSDTNGDTFIPEALSRLLARQKEDRRFEELRDMRIKLLAAIPNLRQQLQTLDNDLEINRAHQEDLNVQLALVRTGGGTPEMLRLKSQQTELTLTLQDFDATIQRTTTRRDRAQEMANTVRKIETEAQTEIRKIEDEVAALREQLTEKSLEYNLLRSKSNASYERHDLLLNTASGALSDYKNLLELQRRGPNEEERARLIALQVAVRDAGIKRDQLQIDEMQSGALETARAKIEAFERRIAVSESDLDRLRYQSEAANERAAGAQRDVIAQEDLLSEALAAQKRVTRDISALQARTAEQAKRDEQSSTSEGGLKTALETLRSDERKLTALAAEVRQTLPTANANLAEVENEINTLLIPRSAENDFKRDISTNFALLVGIVIVMFFLLALWDPKMRQVVFSAEAGIQFVTLFSLVIAIILFGITGILEGKELSALLGGISGYILGRGGSSSANPPPG